MYRVTWVGPSGTVAVEEGISTPNSQDAVEFAAGMYNSLVKNGGQSFTVPGLSGSVAGATAAGDNRFRSVVVVARANLALLYVIDSTDASSSKAVAVAAAQTSGASVPIDPTPIAAGSGTTTGWTNALGQGVSIVQPGSRPAPGTSSPGGAVLAEAQAVNAGQLTQQCQYVEPSVQAECKASVAGETQQGVSLKLTLGFIAIKGDQAVVGTVGQDCEPSLTPVCVTNNDPAALFNAGQSFDALYAAAVAAGSSSTHAYALTPCVEQDGHWYIYIPTN